VAGAGGRGALRRRVGVAERRARLARRHRLALPAADLDAAAASMVALHGTDPTTVYLSLWARTPDAAPARIEQALYEERTLLRLLGMRRTVFAVPTGLAPAVLAACSREVAARERRRLLGWLAEAAVADDVAAWLDEVEAVVLSALDDLGEATATELAACDARLRVELSPATMNVAGVAVPAVVRVGSRVLLVLAAQGRVVRSRPLAPWTSTQFRWVTAARWWAGDVPVLEVRRAEEEVAGRWLAAFGPAPADDLRWWAGWSLTRTRQVLSRIGAVEVDLDGGEGQDGGTGVLLPGDLEPEPPVAPWVALLPALDPTPMGWSRRDFYLGPHAGRLFDRTGNVSPTVWADGRVVGGWVQRPDGEIAVDLLEDVGSEAVTAIEGRAAELAEYLGPVRLAPRGRGRSPLERELLGPPVR
jgi:DNA glycosylase AlkZ-like